MPRIHAQLPVRTDSHHPYAATKGAARCRPLIGSIHGHFDDHHRFLLTQTLARIDADLAAVHRPRQPLPGPRPGEAAVGAGRTDTFLGERYRRIVARGRGTKKAIVAIGRSTLVVIWHLLSEPETRFNDLGADHFTRHVNADAKQRNHLRQLEALGYRVILEPAA